jgi:DNA-binding Xre family transcriptional regulator
MLNYGIQLVRFLVENKHTLATINSIAYHLNEPVESDVQELEKLGLVVEQLAALVVRSPYDDLSALHKSRKMMAHLRLRELADERGVTMSQLRKQSGLSRSQFHRYWHNQVKRPAPAMLSRLATLLDVDPAELLLGPEEEADRD